MSAHSSRTPYAGSESTRRSGGTRESQPSNSRTTRASAARERQRENMSGATSPPAGSSSSRHRSGSNRTGEVLREKRLEKVITTTTTTRRTEASTKETERPTPQFAKTASNLSANGARPPSAPWSPEATLIAPTSAPLASRISIPPLASTLPLNKRPPPLDQLNLELQEATILEDLLFVFMGYEGQYIRFKEDYNPLTENHQLNGPKFKVLPGLDPSLRDMTEEMLRMASYYGAVEAFVEVFSREEYGAVNHALCAAIRKILKDYLILIAQLEHQFISNPNFTLHILYLHIQPTIKVMAQLHDLAGEMVAENKRLTGDEEDFLDDFDDVENILESLNYGGDLGGGVGRSRILKGGNVLKLLTEKLSHLSGDPGTRNLLTMLLREASRPYMTMLNEWLHHGGIQDPHAEFLIREQKSIKRERLEEDYTDEYWEKRYTIRDGDIPPQLEGVSAKVLLAGKYLNVVRECGGVDVSKEVQDVPKTFDDPRFLENVYSAYAHANESLLQLLLTTHALPARLRSLKHYFFLDRSDFFNYFLDLSASELKKPAKSVNLQKLQNLLEIALRQPGSVAASDPFKEDVRVQMNEMGLTKWLMRVVSVSGIGEDGTTASLEETYRAPATQEDEKSIIGYNALELDYTVPFPLSLVISRKTVLRYQLLFRYLLSLRYLETLLTGAWQDHSSLYGWKRKSRHSPIEYWKRRAFTLRARMLVFVQQLLYFCTSEVIEPNWNNLQQKLEMVKTVDNLMQDHVDFLDTCLKECMLTNSKLIKIHAKLMQTCTFFATYSPHLSRALVAADPELAGPGAPHDDSLEAAKLEKLSDNLTKYEDNFSRHLKILLDALNYYAATETVALLSLCARLSTAAGDTDQGLNLAIS